jgi:hypothetical protein
VAAQRRPGNFATVSRGERSLKVELLHGRAAAQRAVAGFGGCFVVMRLLCAACGFRFTGSSGPSAAACGFGDRLHKLAPVRRGLAV